MLAEDYPERNWPPPPDDSESGEVIEPNAAFERTESMVSTMVECPPSSNEQLKLLDKKSSGIVIRGFSSENSAASLRVLDATDVGILNAEHGENPQVKAGDLLITYSGRIRAALMSARGESVLSRDKARDTERRKG